MTRSLATDFTDPDPPIQDAGDRHPGDAASSGSDWLAGIPLSVAPGAVRVNPMSTPVHAVEPALPFVCLNFFCLLFQLTQPTRFR